MFRLACHRRAMLLQATPSWDLILAIAFAIGGAFGFIMQRDRVLVTLFSLYAGLVLSNNLAYPIQKFFTGDTTLLNKMWVQSSASPFAIKLAIFIIVILVIGAKANTGRGRTSLSNIELIGYSVLNVGLALSCIFSFMTPVDQATYVKLSQVASLIIHNQTLWLVGPLVLMLVFGSMRRPASREEY